MKEIGQKLKMAREEKGLSLNEVSQMTKIRSLYLQAIEEGNMERIPGVVYAKGFIKAYASAVELNPNEILAEYQSYLDQLPPEEPEELPEITVMKARNPKPIGKIVTTVLVVVIIGGGLFFVTNLWSTIKNETIPQLLEPEPQVSQGNDQTPSNSDQGMAGEDQGAVTKVNPEGVNQSTTADDDAINIVTENADEAQGEIAQTTEAKPEEATDGLPKTDSTDVTKVAENQPQRVTTTEPETEKVQVTEEKTRTQPTPPKKQSAGDSKAVVEQAPVQPVQAEASSTEAVQEVAQEQEQIQIIADGNSWIRVKVDGTVAFQGELKAGETRLYEGAKFDLRIGNAAAIKVNYHGMIIGPFGDKNELVDKVFGE